MHFVAIEARPSEWMKPAPPGFSAHVIYTENDN